MRKNKASGIRRRRPVLLSLIVTAAIGILGLAFIGEGPSPSYANANCGGQSLAGRWINTGPMTGPDVIAATIAMPCAPAGGATVSSAARIDLSLTVRCLHILSCDWQSVPATQSGAGTAGARLIARYDQQNFDRDVTIEPIDANHVRLKMSSRFKGLDLGSVDATYTLERARG